MASEIKSLAPVAATPLVRNLPEIEGKPGFTNRESLASTPSGSDTHDVEDNHDGNFHQVIQKGGKDVLVSWSKADEARVVRKADFLFLPIFTVC